MANLISDFEFALALLRFASIPRLVVFDVFGETTGNLYFADENGIWSADRLVGLVCLSNVIEEHEQDFLKGYDVESRQVDYFSDIASVRSMDGIRQVYNVVDAAARKLQEIDDIPTGLMICEDYSSMNVYTDRYLGFANGLLDVKAGEILPPAQAREKLISQYTCATLPYDPDATFWELDGISTDTPEGRDKILYSWDNKVHLDTTTPLAARQALVAKYVEIQKMNFTRRKQNDGRQEVLR